MEKIKTDLKVFIENISDQHPSDIAKQILKIKKENSNNFTQAIISIPDDILGDVLLELPESIRDFAYETLSIDTLKNAINNVETDDATDIIQDIEDIDKEKSITILSKLDKEDKDDIVWLKGYKEDQAGAFMQTELFSANINETINSAIKRLKEEKKKEKLENIHQIFIVDSNNILITSILLEDLIILDFNKTFEDVFKKNNDSYSVSATEDIENVVKMFEQYNLSVVAVIGINNKLIGRITSDDIIDVIEQNATEQMYQLAGVDENAEYEDSLVITAKYRGTWLFLNLLTAIFASLTIGLFDDVLKEFIALAILMPIVASMGGNAGTQTLAVMVRQLALGTIELDNSKEVIKKELQVSLINGFIFAFLTGFIAYIWFEKYYLGFVIALSMIINLIAAGFFGAIIPLILKKFKIDPAIGSTVLLTTITDIIGFFSFLWLAKIILM